MNRRRSLRTLKIRVEKHLRPAFGEDAISVITTARPRVYITHRQAQGASNATINRDLITLKRMLTLAVQGGKLTAKPYVPLLKERNVRRGFFEPEQFQRVKAGLPRHMQGIAAFACITGWRTPSEILPLEWAQVDMQAGEVRLEPERQRTRKAACFRLRRSFARSSKDSSRSPENCGHGVSTRDLCSVTPWGRRRGTGSACRRTRISGGKRGSRQTARPGSPTIFVGPRCGISCAPVCLSASPCCSPATRRAQCSSATTS